MALLKYNLYNKKFDHRIQWFLIYSWSCATVTTEHLKTFALSQKEALYPLAVASLPPAPSPSPLLLFFLLLCTSACGVMQQALACDGLPLLCITPPEFIRVLCVSALRSCVFLVPLHCSVGPHFFNPCLSRGTFGLSPFLSGYEECCCNICLQVSMWTCLSISRV